MYILFIPSNLVVKYASRDIEEVKKIQAESSNGLKKN